MPSQRSSIIAFLSGLGAENTSTNPIGNTSTNPIGNTSTNPIGNTSTNPGGNTSTNPGGNTSSNPPNDPQRAAVSLAFDARALQSWEGLDAPWVYSSDDTLMMQALRKSRAKITRLSDPAFVKPLNPRANALFRWAPMFRSEAVAFELGSRITVFDKSVWLIGPPEGAAPACPAQRLFGVPDEADLTAHKSYDLGEQIDSVLRSAIEREDRLPEILAQARGLWPFFGSVTGLGLEQSAAFYDLLIALERWMLGLLMLLKHRVAATRPVVASSLVMPLIETPGHGSMPSGHAAQAAFNAELLSLLLYHDEHGVLQPKYHGRVQLLDRLARRIAFNRVVAGVHFPVDNLVGYWLGRQLARVVGALAGQAPPEPLRELLVADVLKGDKKDSKLAEVLPGDRPPMPTKGRRLKTGDDAEALGELWSRARAELDALRV